MENSGGKEVRKSFFTPCDLLQREPCTLPFSFVRLHRFIGSAAGESPDNLSAQSRGAPTHTWHHQQTGLGFEIGKAVGKGEHCFPHPSAVRAQTEGGWSLWLLSLEGSGSGHCHGAAAGMAPSRCAAAGSKDKGSTQKTCFFSQISLQNGYIHGVLPINSTSASQVRSSLVRVSPSGCLGFVIYVFA